MRLRNGDRAAARSNCATSRFNVRRGEILGIAGLVGAGRTETARAIFGADPFDSGHVLIDGKEVAIRSPQEAIAHGIGLVPEDRKQQALFLSLAIKHQPVDGRARPDQPLALLHRRRARKRRWSRSTASASTSAWRSPDQLVGNLSGGNQQKVVLARWLALGPKVLIVDEPTRGIDVGAKVEVHNLLFEMADAGIAVIAISSELPEILAICRPHRDDARGPRHRRDPARGRRPGKADDDDDRTDRPGGLSGIGETT